MKKAKELIQKKDKRRPRTKKSLYEDLYHKNLTFLPDNDLVAAAYAETKAAMEGQDKEGLNKLLKQALSDYQEKDSGKIQLFKIALLATEMKEKHFAFAEGKRFAQKFASVADFDKIASSEFDRTGLFRYANKLQKMAEITDPSISKEAISIALDTTANVVKVQQILDEERQKAKGKSREEIEANYKEVKAKADPDNVYSMIRLFKSQEYLFMTKKIPPSKVHIVVEKVPIDNPNDENAPFSMAIIESSQPSKIDMPFMDNIPERFRFEKPIPSDREHFRAAMDKALKNKKNAGR